MRLFLLATALLFTVSVADAQIAEDVIEVGGTAKIDFAPDFNVGLAPVVGYFVTPKFQVGANPNVATDFDDFFMSISAFGAYYPTGGTETQTYPFGGLSLGANIAGGDGGGLAIGARVGVQRFVTDSAALTLALNGSTTDDFDFDEADLFLSAGFSVFLNRGEARRIVQ